MKNNSQKKTGSHHRKSVPNQTQGKSAETREVFSAKRNPVASKGEFQQIHSKHEQEMMQRHRNQKQLPSGKLT